MEKTDWASMDDDQLRSVVESGYSQNLSASTMLANAEAAGISRDRAMGLLGATSLPPVAPAPATSPLPTPPPPPAASSYSDTELTSFIDAGRINSGLTNEAMLSSAVDSGIDSDRAMGLLGMRADEVPPVTQEETVSPQEEHDWQSYDDTTLRTFIESGRDQMMTDEEMYMNAIDVGIDGNRAARLLGIAPPLPTGYVQGLDNPYIPRTIAQGSSYLTPETSSVDQLNTMIDSNSPYMQSAANRAREAASASGMLGSTMAIEAAERARIDAAGPFALQDAQTATLFQQQEQAAETVATRDLWQNEFEAERDLWQNEFEAERTALQHEFDMIRETYVQTVGSDNIDRQIAGNLEQTIVQMDADGVRSIGDNLTKLSQQLSVDRTNTSTNSDLSDEDKVLALADLDADYNRNVANLTAIYSASISTGDFTWSTEDSLDAGGEEAGITGETETSTSGWDIDDYDYRELEGIASMAPQREEYPDDFLYDESYSQYLSQYPGIEDFIENPTAFYNVFRNI